MAARVFEVAGGRLRGELVADGAVVRLLGVPYGASVRGSARFIPAAPVMPWAGVRDCLTIGPAAPQPAMVFGVGERGRELAALCAGFTCTEAQDEDCLVLNIWAPAGGGAARPVLVSFHGGAYTVGSSSMPVYDGAWLAEHEDLVVVTVNHRLGALGCLELGELLGERYRSSGAVGQQDLVLALQWVRENIAAFGGDSSRVTIAGVSGGGWKVCHLLAMPQAAGLFHGAIVQSGPRLRALPRDRAAAITHTLLDELGLGATEARRLLDVPADRLVAAQVAATGSPLGDLAAGGRHFAPVLDGEVVPSDPFVPEAPVGSASVPLLIGTTRDELTFFTYGNPALDGLDDAGAAKMARRMSGSDTLYDCYRRTRPSVSAKERLVSVMTDGLRVESIRIAERKAALGDAPVWMYRFDFTTDVCGGALGAPHGMDTAFTFGTPDTVALSGGRPQRRQVADAMAGAWAAFVRSGSPQTAAIPHWPAYDGGDRSTMLFDAEHTVVADPDGEERRAWDGLDTGR